MEKISVVGGGSFGTTIACLLGEKGYKIRWWVREKELADEINKTRKNSIYMPNKEVPKTVTANHELSGVLNDADIIFMVIPSPFLRETATEAAKHIKRGAIVVNAAKGIEEGTYKRMSEILEEVLPKETKIAVLSGPNLAEEIARKIPTASVIASADSEVLAKVKVVLETPYFKIYPHDDIIGVEICGAIKNITAIAVGVCDALGLGDNAKGSIITYGLSEMNHFGKHFGAKQSTFYGLAGVGDLVATCMSKYSRNRAVGEKIAKGLDFEQIKKEMHGQIAEGVRTAKAVYDIALKNKIDMPLTTQVYKVIYEKKDLQKAIKDLIKLI